MEYTVHGQPIGITCEYFYGCISNDQFTLTGCKRDGGKYSGAYLYDEETKMVKGCPARAQTIKQLMKNVRNRDNQAGAAATRHHTEAMHLDDLQKIIACSESQVLLASTCGEQSCPSELHNFLIHNMMHAFLSAGFTLWTR